jgi:sugar diacid utilization regulator
MFHRDWFWALTLQFDERLRDMLAVGARVAQAHPDLAQTVETFAQAGFSAAETARRLSIHLNTVNLSAGSLGEAHGLESSNL